MKLLGTTHSEGFSAEVYQDDKGRVFFTGDLDIDADGANGQHGQQAAYMLHDKGSELLGNGGMRMEGERVVGATDWWKDIVYQDDAGHPLVLKSGIIPSMTSYKFDKSPSGQLDAQAVPYIVVPAFVVERAVGVVKGCRAAATYKGKTVVGLVGDVGPRSKVGEASIAMAKLLGIGSSPRSGGIEKAEVLYELWPGVPGTVDGKEVRLMRANGTYV